MLVRASRSSLLRLCLSSPGQYYPLRVTSYSQAVRQLTHLHRPIAYKPPTQHFTKRTIFIQTTSTPNPQALKFIPTELSTPLLPPGAATVEYLSTSTSIPSSLARSILAIPSVRGVFFSSDFLTVEKEEDGSWGHIKPEVFSLVMEHIMSGQPIIEGEADAREDTRVEEGDSETVQMIKELLETRIRPAIQEDGGDIEYRGFRDGEVLLKLRGACRTCDSSVVTLKNGIEAMMRHYLPDVTSVRQVMDEEEEMALKEFERLEQKLAKAGAGMGNANTEAQPEGSSST